MASAGWLATLFKRSIRDSLRDMGCAFDIALRCCTPFWYMLLSPLELAPPAGHAKVLVMA